MSNYDSPTPPPASNDGYPGGQYAAAPPAYQNAPGGYYGPPKTNSLAIVSLVASLSSLIGFVVVGPIVGVITGHISLGQIKKTREGGEGMAKAGLIIGYVLLALGVLAVIAFFAWILPFAVEEYNDSTSTALGAIFRLAA